MIKKKLTIASWRSWPFLEPGADMAPAMLG